MIPIVLIDDHPLAINGIGAWLTSTGRFTIAGSAKNLSEAKALIENMENLPAIIILDVSLGKEDGLDFISILKEICRKRKEKTAVPDILVCTMHEDPFLIQRAVDLGARAYVPKSAEPGEILKAMEMLLEGGIYIDPKYKVNEPKQAWSLLTPRENEIVSLVKQNLSSKQIAKRLGISLRTVENHLSRIYVKTEVDSREKLLEL